MYTGTLIDDLIATVDRAHRAAKSRTSDNDQTLDSPCKDSRNRACELQVAQATAANANLNQKEVVRAEIIPASVWSERD